ncbi:hypothetical protein Q5P01_007317 [Channa striata]|uniref:Uncharacterized protein n=1 Tax=Channa striata TaxID=64152 RepID=A0AA88NBQ8_CHASR|nr:hypothetical protein Q5P01_007317 [Channa striata]
MWTVSSVSVELQHFGFGGDTFNTTRLHSSIIFDFLPEIQITDRALSVLEELTLQQLFHPAARRGCKFRSPLPLTLSREAGDRDCWRCCGPTLSAEAEQRIRPPAT